MPDTLQAPCPDHGGWELPEADAGEPDILNVIRFLMNNDADATIDEGERLRDAYDKADDNGKTYIDLTLMHVCGFRLPTIVRMATEAGYDYCADDDNAEQTAALDRVLHLARED